jgi:uncharacterized membrane protein YfcA
LSDSIIVDAIMNQRFALAVCAAVVGGIVRGFSGFGAGLVMAPLLALIYGAVDAVVIVLVTALFGGLQLIPGAWRYAAWRDLLPIIAGAAVAAPLGGYLLLVGDPDIMRRFIGGFVLASAMVMLMGWSYGGIRNRWISLLAGILSGAVNGAGGIGGPPATIYLISSRHPAVVKRANIAIAMTSLNIVTITPLVLAGIVTADLFLRAVVLLPAFAGAIYLGSSLFAGATDRAYHLVALWLLVAIGLVAVVR